MCDNLFEQRCGVFNGIALERPRFLFPLRRHRRVRLPCIAHVELKRAPEGHPPIFPRRRRCEAEGMVEVLHGHGFGHKCIRQVAPKARRSSQRRVFRRPRRRLRLRLEFGRFYFGRFYFGRFHLGRRRRCRRRGRRFGGEGGGEPEDVFEAEGPAGVCVESRAEACAESRGPRPAPAALAPAAAAVFLGILVVVSPVVVTETRELGFEKVAVQRRARDLSPDILGLVVGGEMKRKGRK